MRRVLGAHDILNMVLNCRKRGGRRDDEQYVSFMWTSNLLGWQREHKCTRELIYEFDKIDDKTISSTWFIRE